MSMNKVILTGNIVRDIELKYTPQGTAIGKTALAVNDNYGENKKTYFVDITLWGKRAENFNKFLKKGDPILISGKLIQETWTAQDGSKKSKHSVQVNEFEFMKRGGKEDNNTSSNNTQQQSSNTQQQQSTNGNEDTSGVPDIDIDEENIPF